MNRIQTLFAKAKANNEKIFTAYLTMGFPNMEYSERTVETLIDNGVDIIEFGVPFSDPMADGPVIRDAARIALQNGANLAGILKTIARLRKRCPDVPFVLFSYYNVLFSYGLERFAEEAEQAGVDAVLAVDVVLEEREELLNVLRPHHMTVVPLVAPTTHLDRVAEIAKGVEDSFLYVITVNGVTGARAELPAELTRRLNEIRNVSGMPVLAGFGIGRPEQAEAVCRACDGFIVGSAIVKILLDNPNDEGLKKIAEFAKAF